MIKVKGLRKSFRSRQGREVKTVEAVRGVDLHVAEGEIFGFLGPNGAGKTTTLRMLATLIPPDGGEAMIAGADLRKRAGRGAATDRLRGPGRQHLGRGHRPGGAGAARPDVRHEQGRGAAARGRALEAFQLTEFADRKCKTYSGGQRRRVDIALGIIHEPKVVFLDEPTTGLDPQSRAHMWDEIRRLRAEGMTVFLTTHYLEEADALCDRIAIIDHGQIVAEGTPADLKRDISGDVVLVNLRARSATAAKVLDAQPYVRKLETDDGGLRLYVDHGGTAVPQIMRALDGADLGLESIEVHRPSLDDVFLAKTGRSLREE